MTKLGRYRLYQGDCLEVMDILIKENIKIDLTVTSPPYDDIRNYNDSLVQNFDIFKQVADRLYSITKDGGVVVWVVNDKTKNGSETGTSFRQALYFKEIGFNLHDTMIYYKNNPIPTQGKRYHQHFEYMFVFSKGTPKTFNPIMEECKYKGIANMKNRGKNGTLNYKKINRTEKKKTGNVFFYSIGGGITTKDKFAFKHPAMFPEKLAEDHILSWSNENDLVFDPFMGANTTGKMALLNNRRFIGIENVGEYFEISKKRMENILDN